MHRILANSLSILGAWSMLSLAGCPSLQQGNIKMDSGEVSMAIATLDPRSNSTATGTATFQLTTNKVNKIQVSVELSGVTPGQHALHIHEKGDCSDPSAMSAGDHFNPRQMAHGNPDSSTHHAGDYGNVTIGEDGKGKVLLVTDEISLGTGPDSIIGRAIVLHEKTDDFTTQPSGNAGARIACGVITAKK